MHTHRLFHRTIGIAASMLCILVMISPVSAKSKVNDQNVTAVSETVTGNVQQVGFRAMIQKQAIQYNLAGIADNKPDTSVQFTLQGDGDRITQALETIRKGTKTSDPKVNVDPPQHNYKKQATARWLTICERTVKGEAVGKCDKADVD